MIQYMQESDEPLDLACNVSTWTIQMVHCHLRGRCTMNAGMSILRHDVSTHIYMPTQRPVKGRHVLWLVCRGLTILIPHLSRVQQARLVP
jgi:hypothetical protein